jgi:hypothetical protein
VTKPVLPVNCGAQRHFDADIAPIRALIDQGCDLEADILPIIAREVPKLPRPLKNWGAPWLVREILAAREQRLAGHRVDEPPPPRRAPPAIDWDEFVGGYRAGLIEWNTARLGPKPGVPGCRAPAEVLRDLDRDGKGGALGLSPRAQPHRHG